MTRTAGRGHRWVRRWWDGRVGWAGVLATVLTAPVTAAFRAVVSIRSRAYASGVLSRHAAGIPVVSVGNLTVGGTGKTPLVRWLVQRLSAHGYRPAIVTRGYGADEVRLYRRWFPGVGVYVGADRAEGARRAEGDCADVVVLDDGFQHRRLDRDLDLVLVAAEDPLSGRLLPGGPYREPLGALRRADCLLLTHRTATPEAVARWRERLAEEAPGVPVASVALRPGRWSDLRGERAGPPEGPLLAVAAIGAPERFGRMVEWCTGQEVELLPFPDHYDYTEQDADTILRRAGGRAVVVTEKDAVKLERFPPLKDRVRVLGLQVAVEDDDGLLEMVLRATGPVPPSTQGAPRGGGGRAKEEGRE